MAERLPELQIRTPAPADAYAGSAPVVAGSLGELADGLTGLSNQLGQLADRKSVVEASAQAARDVEAGAVKPVREDTVWGRAYAAVAREHASARLQSAIDTQMAEAWAKTPNDPEGLKTKFAAIRQGFKQADVQLDAAVGDSFARLQSDYLGKAFEGKRKSELDAARGASVEIADTQGRILVQAAAASPFDAGGRAKIDAAFKSAADNLARLGPQEAFKVAGFDYPADPTRAGAWSAKDLGDALSGLKGRAVQEQLRSAVEKAPNAAAKAALVADIKDRWAKGDPLLDGINADDVDPTFRRLDAIVNAQEVDERADRAEAAESARNMIEAYTLGSADVDPAAMKAAAARSGDIGLKARAEFVARNGGGTPDFSTFTDYMLDQLENNAAGRTDVNGRRVQYGLNAAAHPEVDRPGGVSREYAKGVYRRDYWDKIGADQLDPDIRFQAYDAAIVQGPENARRWVAESGGDPLKYAALRLQHFEKLARDDPKKFAGQLDGWRNRVAQVMGISGGLGASGARAALGSGGGTRPLIEEDGFVSDPIGYAMGGKGRPPLASVPPVPLEAAFSSDPAQLQAFGAVISKRRALGQELVRTQHAPQRMLTNGERAFYEDKIKGNAAAGIALGAAVSRTAGPDAALALLREVGLNSGEAATAVHIADLSVRGSAGFARTAAQGLALKAQGAKAPRDDDTKVKLFDGYQSDFGPAFQHAGQVLTAVRQTAELARYADQAEGRDHPAAWYMQSAAGGHSRDGVLYGGVAKVNGRMTVIPSWLRADRAEDALGVLSKHWAEAGTGPVWSNGQPMKAHDIARLQPVMRADGKYLLVNARSGAPARVRDGRVLTVDFDQARPWLRRQLPGAVIAGP